MNSVLAPAAGLLPAGAELPRPRVIGLLGGMSWESSAEYYRLLNVLVRERLGGLHSAECLLPRWTSPRSSGCRSPGGGTRPASCSPPRPRGLEAAGAELLLFCTNTMHKVADQVAGRRRGPAAAPRRHHRRRRTAAGLTDRRAARHRVHHGAGLLPRPAGLPRPERCWSRTPRTGPWCTGSSTTSCAWAWSATSRGRPTGAVIEPAGRGRAPRASSSAAPRSSCWSAPSDSPVPVFPTTRLHVEAAVSASLQPSAPVSAG